MKKILSITTFFSKKVLNVLPGALLILFSVYSNLWASEKNSMPGGPQPAHLNFTSFTQLKNENQEELLKFNSPQYRQHPNLLYPEVKPPQNNWIEDFSKRKIDEKYFIDLSDPSKFCQQKSLGDLHYLKNGHWLDINYHLKSLPNGLLEASAQAEPTGFNLQNHSSYIQTIYGQASFNQWELWGENNQGSVLIAKADWSDYTAGDDGIYIRNIFPGIDATFRVLRGAIKTSFIVQQNNFSNYQTLVFRDQVEAPGVNNKLKFKNLNQKTGQGRLVLASSENEILEFAEAFAYPENYQKSEIMFLDYRLVSDQIFEMLVPVSYLQSFAQGRKITIDPLVSSSNTLAQASITGSRYNASCNFTNFCNYNLNVNTPPAAVLTDVTIDFDYVANGLCWMEDGATRFTLGGCTSPNVAGFYWFCALGANGTCQGNGISIFSDISTCLPATSCLAQNLTFGLQFFRSCWGNAGAGCNDGACIGAASPWTVTIYGQTVGFASAAPNQFTTSTTTLCQGQSLTASTLGATNGLAPYTINWSFSPTGLPSVGSGASVNLTFPTAGNIDLYCIVTDACGSTSSASNVITVNALPSAPVVSSPLLLCQNSVAAALTATGTGLLWYTSAVGGTASGAPTPSTGTPGTVSYYVSQTVGGCESPRAQLDVTVNSLPSASGSPTVTPSSCGGSDGGLAGLTVSGNGPLSFQWFDATSNPVTVPSASPDLTNQPAGDYTIIVTDVNGCTSSYGLLNIPTSVPPSAPLVTSPVNYCQNATASALTATGTGLLWYTAPSGGTGSATAPVPSTSSSGTTAYYVSQTIGGCESSRSIINVIVTATPAAPSVSTPVNYCLNSATVALTASGSTLLWYTVPSGGIGSTTPPTPSSSSSGTISYYVSQTVSSCESPLSTIVVNVNTLPVYTGTASITNSNCGLSSGSITGLSATGNGPMNYNWTDLGGNSVSTGLNPDLTGQGAGDYTVTVTDINGCTSVSGPYTISNTSAPSAPGVTSPVNYCQNATAVALNATGTSLLWYTTPVGGTGSSTAPIPSTSVAGTTQYYVSQTQSGCESTRSIISVIVTATPASPLVSSPVNYCENTTAAVLTATGTSLLWYNVPSGGTGSATAPTPNTTVAGTTSYYVSQNVGGCESPLAPVIVNIFTNPVISGTAVINPASCGSAIGSITGLTASGSNPITYIWSDQFSTVVASGPNPDLTGMSAGTYSLTVTDNNGCSSVSGPYVITNPTAPAAPAVNTPVNYCEFATASALTATGTSLLWYTLPVGGTGSTTAPVPLTTPPGSVFYYVSQTVSGCESVRAAIEVLVTATPAAPTVVSPLSICQGSTATPLNAGGSSLLWYNTPTGGTGSSTPPTPSTSVSGSTDYYVSQSINGCESLLSQITVNVTAQPAAPVANTPVQYCQNTASIPLTAIGTALLWYTQSTGGTGSSTAITPSTALAGNFTYYVSQTVAGCESPLAPVNVIVDPAVMAVVNVQASQTGICADDTVLFTAVGQNTGTAPVYQWLLNGNPIAGANQSTYEAFNINSGDVFSVVLTSNAPCVSPAVDTSSAIQITINPPVSPSVTLIADNQIICDGQPVTLTALAGNGGLQPLFNFMVNGVSVQSGNSNEFSSSALNNGSAITVTMTSNAGCLVAGSNPVTSNSIVLQVKPRPTVEVFADPQEFTTDQPVNLSVQTNISNALYSWSPTETVECINCSTTVAHPIQTTTFEVIIQDPQTGCVATDTIVVSLSKEFGVFLPTAFSPDGEGVNNVLYVRARNLKSVLLEIYDRWGNKVFHTEDASVGWDGTFNGKPVQSGCYIYRLTIEKPDSSFETTTGNIQLMK